MKREVVERLVGDGVVFALTEVMPIKGVDWPDYIPLDGLYFATRRNILGGYVWLGVLVDDEDDDQVITGLSTYPMQTELADGPRSRASPTFRLPPLQPTSAEFHEID